MNKFFFTVYFEMDRQWIKNFQLHLWVIMIFRIILDNGISFHRMKISLLRNNQKTGNKHKTLIT